MERTSHISLKELLSLVKRGIEAAHPFAYWVVAEISEIKVNYSGHCYMELIEKQQGQSTPTASVRAVIWRSKYAMIAPYFKAATSSELVAGMKVMVKATVQYSEIYGFSLQISDIDPTYTLGDNERQRMQTIEQLKKDGIFDMNREYTLPMFVGKVAVISSANAAGFEDFMRELDSQWNFDVTVFEAFVQGNGAQESIIGALEAIAQDSDNFDAVVLIRGGGSSNDLSCFDSYRLCSHIAQFPLPVITGIGHNKDVSVADMVACLSLKTPTAVAVFLKDTAAEAYNLVEQLSSQISAATTAIISEQKQRLTQDSLDLNIAASQILGRSKQVLGRLNTQVMMGAMSQIQNTRGRLDTYKQTIRHSIARELLTKRNTLEVLAGAVATKAREALSANNRRIASIESLVWAHNPQRLLEAGFAIVKSQNRSLQSVDQTSKGEMIEIYLADGKIKTEIKEIWKSKSKTSATTRP